MLREWLKEQEPTDSHLSPDDTPPPVQDRGRGPRPGPPKLPASGITLPFFSYADAGARADDWWLRVEPKPARSFIAAATKAVPVLMHASTVPDPVESPTPPAVQPPRRVDRIALLRDLQGKFDPAWAAGLLGKCLSPAGARQDSPGQRPGERAA